MNEETLARLGKLIAMLQKKAMYHQDKIIKAHLREMPESAGDFRLNVENDSPPMWIPVRAPSHWGRRE